MCSSAEQRLDNPTLLIIGYGNTLRRDDGVGVEAARWAGEHLARPGVRIFESHQLVPEMAEDIACADRVVFIDASVAGLGVGEGRSPGEVVHEVIKPADESDPSLGHHITPQVLLAMASAIFGGCPEADQFTVVGSDFDHGSGLSEPVARGLSRLQELLRAHTLTERSCP